MQKVLDRIHYKDFSNASKSVLMGLFFIYPVYKSVQAMKTMGIKNKWRQVCLDRKKQLDDKIAAFRQKHIDTFQLIETLKIAIISASIQELKKLIFDGTVTIKQVLLTYIERTLKYAITNNWLADVCFDEALALAIQQDLQVQQDKNVLYAEGNDLFGIPVSVKDMFEMKGYDATFGLASRCFKLVQFDGNQVHMIKMAGGIIFVKTSMPQIGMSFENNNFIFGRAKNPFNPLYTTGGSSGGEGGVLSAKCSLIGMGTDIGGSIRIPASFNGIYGYKPSTKRMCPSGSTKLHAGYIGGRNLVATNGPMGRNVEDMAIMMKVLLDERVYEQAPILAKDLYFKPKAWDQKLYTSRPKLTIGYFKSLSCLPSCSANQRAIDLAVDALRKQGHTLVPIDLTDKLCEDALQLSFKFCMADDYRLPNIVLEGEQYIPEYQNLMILAGQKKPVLNVVYKLLMMLNLNRLAFTLRPALKQLSAFDLLCESGKQVELQNQMKNLWESYNVDAIISPLTAGVAIKHGQSRNCLMTLVYCMIWNLFDYGAGIVPITSVLESEQHYNVQDTYSRGDATTSALKESLSTSKGLPVSVQVITRPLCDELCLSIMKQLQDEIGFIANPPQ